MISESQLEAYFVPLIYNAIETGEHRANVRYELYWRHVQTVGQCLVWTGATAGVGIWREGNQLRSAPKVAYEQMIGPIPEGMQLVRACTTRFCVDPFHQTLQPKGRRQTRRIAGKIIG